MRFRETAKAWILANVNADRAAAARWVSRSLYVMPLLWIAGALFWLVPLLSPCAPGHALYLVPILIWPFLLLLALGSFCSLMLARGNQIETFGRTRRTIIGALQVLLLLVFVIGSVPILTFDLAPTRAWQPPQSRPHLDLSQQHRS